MQVPTDFFTLETLFTFTGATVASWLVPYAFFVLIGEKFRPYMKWVSFVMAIVLMELAAFLNADTNWIKYVIAAINGVIIFLSAVGANTIAANRSMRVEEVPHDTLPGAEGTAAVTDSNTAFVAVEGSFKHWF